MSEGVKTEVVLMGLNCASCAAKIENEVQCLAGVKSARVDFVLRKLVLEVASKQELSDIIAKISQVAKNIEPDIVVIHENQVKNDDHTNNRPVGIGVDRNKLGIMALGATLFMVAMVFPFPFWMDFTLFFISYMLVGGGILFKAIRNITKGKVFDENFLMSIATLGAFGIGEFAEGVAVMLFYKIGEFLQDLAVNRSRRSIESLIDLRPDYANLVTNDGLQRVNPEKVGVGDLIVVKPGEKVPLDGVVKEGKSTVDTSAITGEFVPRQVGEESEIFSGFVNQTGALTVKVSKEFGESTVSKIIDLVENASSRKAFTENFITKFARYYTPVVVFVAMAIMVIPLFLIKGAVFSEWVYRALIFLVISCPCALVISIPLSFFGGIGSASRNGILVKGGNYLEALNKIDTVVFDKTGTLTKGVFKVTGIRVQNNIKEDELLEYAAYAESYSNHPIAHSILGAYGKQVVESLVQNYEEIPGYGVKSIVKNREVLVGNSKLMDKERISYKQIDDAAGTVVHVVLDKKYAGCIIISDQVKEDSLSAVKALRDMGVRRIVMFTGDSKHVAEKVAAQLGLDEVYAELLPDQKVERLEIIGKERTTNGKMVFVGDGVNDAPVLAMADIGVAMGGLGSDAAIEAADVVLMNDEPSKLATAIAIARRTRKIVWQNIVFALAVKAFVLVTGAGGIVTMWEAVFADVGVALIAVLNAMRVMRVKGTWF